MASQVALVVENPPANTGDTRDAVSTPGSGRSPGVENSTPLQYSCLENSKFPGQRNLVGYSPWGLNESNTTERLNTHTHTHTHATSSFLNFLRKYLFIWLHWVLVTACGIFLLCMPHLYPFICWWILRLFPYLGYCKSDYLSIVI